MDTWDSDGPHEITLKKVGYKTVTKSVVYKKGKKVTHTENLEKKE